MNFLSATISKSLRELVVASLFSRLFFVSFLRRPGQMLSRHSFRTARSPSFSRSSLSPSLTRNHHHHHHHPTMSSSSSTTITTLEQALVRIRELEDQLAQAHRLFAQHCSRTLSDYLVETEGRSRAPVIDGAIARQSSSSSSSAAAAAEVAQAARGGGGAGGTFEGYREEERETSPSSSVGDVITKEGSSSSSLKGKSSSLSEEQQQPTSGGGGGQVDIGAFVLRALSLRKNLAIGIVDSLEAEHEFHQIVDHSGLSAKQVSQVREWSGLA